MAASLSRVRPLTNPSAWISSNWSVRSRWSTKRPVSKIRSWLKLNLCTYTERRGIAGTIEARTAESEIMPLRLPPRSEVIATTGEVRLRRSRSEEHTSELQSQSNIVCRLLLEKKKKSQHRRNVRKEKMQKQWS